MVVPLHIMFIKSIVKSNKATGERKEHFRLCESYRSGNTVKHLTIIHLGSLEQLPQPEQKRLLGRRIEQLIQQEREGNVLFAPVPPEGIIEQLAQKFYFAIKEKQRIDIASGKDYHMVDINSLKNEDVREVGIELRLVLLPAVLMLAAALCNAQSTLLDLPRQSQHAIVMQRIGVTDITINYHRPLVNGRKIFGGQH